MELPNKVIKEIKKVNIHKMDLFTRFRFFIFVIPRIILIIILFGPLLVFLRIMELSNNTVTLYYIADTLYNMNEYNRSIRVINKILSIDDSCNRAKELLENIHKEMGE